MQTVFIFFLFLSFNPFSKWRLFSISEKALEKRERERENSSLLFDFAI
jgi:hypothetical protein